ncbi:glycosyltransferase [Labilibacter sediminis]|nr:glycosyltransferase [Labilibacter sediminis]
MLQLIVIIFTALVFTAYILLIVYFTQGWQAIKEVKVNPYSNLTPSLSIIIPFRNEAHNLENLISCLNAQSYPKDQFEIIFIDDESSDDSYQMMKELIKNHHNYKLIKNEGLGKKDAISSGIKMAAYNYIVTTDADCLFHPNWLLAIGQHIEQYDADLIIGPVMLQGPDSFLSQFQTIDFLSLVTSGAGAAGCGHPIMCNAANLTVKREILQEAQQSVQNKYASGDDIFLLQYCKARNKKIHFLKNKEAIVSTHTVERIKCFFNQRARWTSKSKAYTDKFTIAVAWLVFITNVFMLMTQIYAILKPIPGIYLLLAPIIKIIADYGLLKKGAVFFNISLSIPRYMKMLLAYPFYIIITVVWATFGMVEWKNRKI